MSTLMITDEDCVPAARPTAASRRSTDWDGRPDDHSSFRVQLAVVREMLAMLDTLTVAGQHHMMSKVVAFIQEHAPRRFAGVGARNHGMFTELLQHLVHESQRLRPDSRTFTHRAESLVALLAAVA